MLPRPIADFLCASLPGLLTGGDLKARQGNGYQSHFDRQVLRTCAIAGRMAGLRVELWHEGSIFVDYEYSDQISSETCQVESTIVPLILTGLIVSPNHQVVSELNRGTGHHLYLRRSFLRR